jgi:predicted XRE-type DNA-binding protein
MKARSREQPSHTHGGPNVYADLGYRDPDRMFIKAQLVSRIAELLAERRITQAQVKTSLGIPQPVLSKLLRGRFRAFSERRLMNCLTQLGQNAQIVVRKTLDYDDAGAVSVTFE